MRQCYCHHVKPMKTLRLWFGALGARWRGATVTCRREDPGTDVVTIRIDPRDGSQAQIVVLQRRNDVFQWAAVTTAFLMKAYEQSGSTRVTGVTLTHQPADESLPTTTLVVPDWAVRSLFIQLINTAFELGWQGECPQPGQSDAYRR